MARYSRELKERIVKKMTPPNSQSVAGVAKETGISAATLYTWRKQFRSQGYVVPSKPTKPNGWDAKAKLAAVIQTAVMNEAERSAWCRGHGLYPEQLDAWKEAFEAADPEDAPASNSELGAERKKRRRLEKELKRKDKALSETAALLALSKKAEAIWGTDEDN